MIVVLVSKVTDFVVLDTETMILGWRKAGAQTLAVTGADAPDVFPPADAMVVATGHLQFTG